jgi:hypothetical protein
MNNFPVRRGDGMPRQARLDAPGTLHHVIVRGIEKWRIANDGEIKAICEMRQDREGDGVD